MKIRQFHINAKINIILALFSLIIAAGVVFILSRYSVSVIYQQISSLVVFLLVWIAILVAIKRYFHHYFTTPLKKLARISRLASVGDLSHEVAYENEDEIGQIASAIDQIVQNKRNLAEFSEKIGDGDFDVEYSVLSEKDKLGYSVTGMRDKLHKVAAEDTKRNWISGGLAKFGEILRSDVEDFASVCETLLSNLVKYLNANQGAIFIVNENEELKLDLISSYAWGRKKHIEKSVFIGEGIIGQAVIEKDTVYITDVPEDFITITSGLGDANPRSILIVPLLFNNEVLGALELAAFKPLDKYEIRFVEQLAEIIASTISTAKTNEQTQTLLKDSQKLTEEMRAQEEEMRQNLEEMNATQDEMQLREVERIGIFTAINNTLGTVEHTMEGKIIDANEKFLSMMDYTFDEIENKPDRMFSDKSKVPIEEYNKFWRELVEGKVQQGDFKRITKNGREIWLNTSYTPALDKDGKPYKVIQLAQDITEKKKAELESKRQAEELLLQGEELKKYTSELEDIKQNLSEKLDEAGKGLKKQIRDIEEQEAKNIAVLEGCVDGVISFNQSGTIEYFNKAAEEIWGIQRDSIMGKSINSIMPVTLEKKDKQWKAFLSRNGSATELDVRTEVSLKDNNSNDLDLLVTLTRAKLNDETTFTIFAQNISVDLF
ncbi:MAG: PAS domain S-box protein [Bacteroidetes bacterium]|nr:PAS domain S-box protein [Bacteroidota bacterium]